MSNGVDRQEERAARAVVASVTGAIVTATDTRDAPPGTVDARLDYADGRVGTMEVTTLGLPEEFEVAAKIKRLGGHLPMRGSWKWLIRVKDPGELPRIQAAYGTITTTCERYKVQSPSDLPAAVIESDPDLLWAVTEAKVTFFGCLIPDGAVDKSGLVDLSYSSPSAAFAVMPEFFVDELNVGLRREPVAKRIRKLAVTSADERHLFLRVSWSGLNDASWIALIQWSIEPETQPSLPAPDLPAEITHLWLLTGWSQRVTRWIRGVGWDQPEFT